MYLTCINVELVVCTVFVVSNKVHISNMCMSTENLPKRESVWRRDRSSWSFGGSNRSRESWLGTWSGSAKQVSPVSVSSDLGKFVRKSGDIDRTFHFFSVAAEEVLLEEEDEIAEEKSPLDGAWYKRTQNLSGENTFFFNYSGTSTERERLLFLH